MKCPNCGNEATYSYMDEFSNSFCEHCKDKNDVKYSIICPNCKTIFLSLTEIGLLTCPVCTEQFYQIKSNSNKEICICAAIRCEDGTIIRGHQHRDCRDGAIRRGKKPAKDWSAEGFITSVNRYVDREEGYRLMKEVGWESKNPQGYQLCEFLFSEDLY